MGFVQMFEIGGGLSQFGLGHSYPILVRDDLDIHSFQLPDEFLIASLRPDIIGSDEVDGSRHQPLRNSGAIIDIINKSLVKVWHQVSFIGEIPSIKARVMAVL